MNKKTIAITVALALGATGCSFIAKNTNVKVGNKTTNLSKVGDDWQKHRERAKECEKLKDMQVAVEEEVAIGQVIALNFASQGGLMIEGAEAERLTRYVNVVGQNLAAQSSRPALQWTFGVINSEEFNAFSAPGGYVFVTSGLLKEVKAESELAGVLGHEIAHVSERHAMQVYAAVKANQCKTALAGASAGKVAKSVVRFEATLDTPGGYLDLNDVANAEILGKLADKVVDNITSKGFAHDDEYEADLVAAALITNAGYTPVPYYNFLKKIPSEGGAFKNHPKTEERRKQIADWAKAQKVAAQTDPFVINPFSKELRKVPIKGQLAAVR